MKKWLLGNPEYALKNSFIWNMIASGINASEAIIILMIATRTVGIEIAGYFTISFTVANLMMCVGKYGVRNYQVTDTKNEFSFEEYFFCRIITLCFMFVATTIYLINGYVFNSYDIEKILIVLIVTFIYGIEAFEDVFLAGLQHNGRLDIGTKMFSFRWFITLLIWGLGLIVSKNAIVSTLIAAIVDCILVIYLTKIVGIYAKSRKFVLKENLKIYCNSVKILKKCLPLCIAAFTAIYLPNAAKYAIDACLTDEEQAYYGFVSMPVFVIDLLSMIIFQPLLMKMSYEWHQGKFKEFNARLFKLAVLLFGITICVLLGGFILGIPVLSLLYGVNLEDYKSVMMILLLGGSALGYIGLFTSVLTIMRKQKFLMLAYVFVSAIAVLTLNYVVEIYGIKGVAGMNSLLLLGLAVILIGEINFAASKIKSDKGSVV